MAPHAIMAPFPTSPPPAATTPTAAARRGGTAFLLLLFALLLPAGGFAQPLAGPPPASDKSGAAGDRLMAIVVQARLNSEPKGDFFAYRDSQGNWLLRAADLESLGLLGLPAGVDVEGERYVRVEEIAGLRVTVDERTLTLNMDAAPEALQMKVLDFQPARPKGMIETRDNSAFLNYLLGYTWGAGSAPGVLSLDAALNVRLMDSLFFTDGRCAKTSSSGRCVRGFTSITRDSRTDLTRLVAGDFFASSGDLGSTLNLAGLSFSKVYDIDPYFIRNPMARFTGAVQIPSQSQLFLDGAPVGSQRLPPGPFLLQNISYYGGARNLELVIRDAAGREQRLDMPFYFTDLLLREGLMDYSYNIGFQRRDFGTESWNYQGLAVSAFHRYGFSDWLTLGVRGEAADKSGNLGPQLALKIDDAGVITANAAVSYDGDSYGQSGTLTYTFQSTRLNATALVRAFSSDYAFAGDAPAAIGSTDNLVGIAFIPVKPRFEAVASLSYSLPNLGSVGVTYSRLERYAGPDREGYALILSGNPMRNLSITASIGHARERESGMEFFIGVSYFPTPDYTASYTQRRDHERLTSINAQIGKRTPVGEGWGWDVFASGQGVGTPDGYTVSPAAQYNGPYGEYRASALFGVDGLPMPETYQVSTAGAVAYAGGAVRAGRPIADSFGIVRIPGVEGVRVYQNSEEVGRTDEGGVAFIPRMSSYVANQIRIDDRDVPMELSLKLTTQLVSPPLRGGAVVTFEATRYQAVTGFLVMAWQGRVTPMEGVDLRVRRNGSELILSTGRGGEFYLENPAPGAYTGEVSYDEKKCRVELRIPESRELMLPLGKVTCEAR